MSSQDRRAAARRRAWGRGPMILRFEPLEGRQLLATGAHGPDLVATSFQAPSNLHWGDPFHATGTIQNQGDATATKPFHVDVYAATGTDPGPDDVKVGSIDIPAGLTAGTQARFDKVLTLPAWPIPDLGTAPSFYLRLAVDPDNAVGESNTDNNVGFGVGSNYTVVTVLPTQHASLAPGAFSVTPGVATWGDMITVNAQVNNNGDGDAPATTASVVLTPFGQQPGGPNDVTIGKIAVPAIATKQSVQATGAIALPSKPLHLLDGTHQFIVSLVLDADHQTTTATKPAGQGFGIDEAPIQISTATGVTAPTPQQLPDLNVARVQGPAQALNWGQSFQVATTLQNTGHADVGPFKVRFALVSDADPSASPLALADATVPGLQAGFRQDVTQTLSLGGALPEGLTPGSSLRTHVVVTVDPDHVIDRPVNANSTLNSGPITLNVVGTDGQTTPVLPPAGPVVTPPPPPSTTPPITTPPPATPPATNTQTPPPTAPTPTPPRRQPHVRIHVPAHRRTPHPHVVIHRPRPQPGTFPRIHVNRTRPHPLRVFRGARQA